MIPKFTNPHLRVQSTQVVSRHDLRAGDVEGNEEPVQDDVLATLEILVKRSLGEFQLQHGTQEGNASPERKKKRRKVDVITDSDVKEGVHEVLEEPVPFRLVSNSRTPTLLLLKPKPAPVIKVLEPAYEDDDNEAQIRAERAAAVAVDAAWITEESQRLYPAPRHDRLTTVTTSADFEGPPMFVAEVSQRPNPSGPMPLRPRLPEKTRPSPHALHSDRLKYSAVECDLPNEAKRRKRSRRRGKSWMVERPPPSFYRPMSEWRGKSAGYAFGYPGSRPMWTESVRWRTYHRDNLRKVTVVV